MDDALRKRAGRSWDVAYNTQGGDVPTMLAPSPPKPETLMSDCQKPKGFSYLQSSKFEIRIWI